MRTLTIPGTDLNASVLCLGTNRFGSELDAAASAALLDAFFEQGGTFIDTAHIYADWIPTAIRSASETMLGAWLKDRRCRDRIVLATKGAHPDLATMHIPRLSRGDLVHDVDASLTCLQTDRIDLYWLHRDDPATPVGEILETLNDIQSTGKILNFGCSNWQAQRLRAAQDYADAHAVRGFVANQPQWSLAAPNRAGLSDPERLVVFDQAARAYHVETGLAVMPWSAQGQGYFDKLDRLGPDGLSPADRLKYDSPRNRALLPIVKSLAERHGVPVGAIALGYLLAQPFPTYPVIGPRTSEHLAASLRALEVMLAPDEIATLERGA